ncbi:hypothetical protein EST38_g14034 [Candolleomyces aberdarensis]|uniref:Uncharacterized protein n=1 Tax=Candolleomyces aberdarensis TaxID=2316362 RepID=A0A4Q2D0R3_9AGAR|nr:hypothetical protein EST38_g14034 [Candolleomyces aberdarensis]
MSRPVNIVKLPSANDPLVSESEAQKAVSDFEAIEQKVIESQENTTNLEKLNFKVEKIVTDAWEDAVSSQGNWLNNYVTCYLVFSLYEYEDRKATKENQGAGGLSHTPSLVPLPHRKPPRGSLAE